MLGLSRHYFEKQAVVASGLSPRPVLWRDRKVYRRMKHWLRP
jgi:hypothetical protein